MDLIRRALAAGYAVVYDPRLVVFHQIEPGRLRRSYFRRYYFDTAECEALCEGAKADRRLLGVPLYRYRYALAALVDWLVALSVFRRDRFERELEFIAALGKLRGHWLSYRSRKTLPTTRRNNAV